MGNEPWDIIHADAKMKVNLYNVLLSFNHSIDTLRCYTFSREASVGWSLQPTLTGLDTTKSICSDFAVSAISLRTRIQNWDAMTIYSVSTEFSSQIHLLLDDITVRITIPVFRLRKLIGFTLFFHNPENSDWYFYQYFCYVVATEIYVS